MQGRDDVAGFIAGFAGDDRYIVDYLVEEVLQRQPERRPELPAADLDPRPAERPAVRCRHRPGRRQGDAGGARARQPVPGPARRPPPLVPLPPPLRRRAAGAPAGRAARPRRRTCTGGRATGTSSNGERSEAIRHALAGGDFERAADLVELAIAGAAPEPAGGHAAGLARGAARRAVPGPARAQHRPAPASLMVTGRARGRRGRGCGDAERWLDADGRPAAEMVVVDDEAFRTLPTAIALYRAGTALVRGDVDGHDDARPAGARPRRRGRPSRARSAPPRSWGSRTGRAATSTRRTGWYADAMAEPGAGRVPLRRARRRHRAGRHPHRAGSPPRGDGASTSGRCSAREQAQPVLRGAADMHVGLSERAPRARRSRRRPAAPAGEQRAGRARRPAAEPLPLAGRDGADPRGRGRPGRRRSTCSTRRSACTSATSSPTCGRSRRCGRGCWLAQGRWRDALGWARERGPVRRRRPQLPARVRAHHPRPGAPGPVRGRARRALDRRGDRPPGAPAAARPRTAGGRAASSRSWCCRRSRTRPRGDVPAALASLRRALTLAEPEGYVRIFVDEGPPMAALLRAVGEGRRRRRYVRRLLAAVDGDRRSQARRRRAWSTR